MATRSKRIVSKRASKSGPVAKRKTAAGSKAARPTESQAARKARALRISAALQRAYPDADCALRHRNALELLVATILSAQCTDERVNMVTPNLFRRYPNAETFAKAEQAELEAAIRSTGFFRNKARCLIGVGKTLREKFAGKVPDSMEQLLQLPGVARKTANCVLGTWYGKNEGVVVDTHVGRLALRLQLLETAQNDKDAVKIEQDLMKLFPRKLWTFLAHALILHGRAVCRARKPACSSCELATDCPSAGSFD